MWQSKQRRPTPESGAGRFENERHLQADHGAPDLEARSIGGGALTVVAQGLKVCIQFAAFIVLARLLVPKDFGLFAMVAVFLSVFEFLKDMGLSTVTVQRRDISQSEISTLFWLNVGLGIAVAVLLAVLAPGLAWFYGEPVLLDLAPVVAIGFIFTGLAAQHLALLRRQMNFRRVVAIQLSGDLIGMTAAVAAAFAGFGLWSLVVQRLAWAIATAVGAWLACGWRPSRPGRLAEVKSMIVFGSNISGSMIVSRIASSMDKVLIGWYWGSSALGFFERAQKLTVFPIQNLNVPLATVAMPALSRLADQPARYRRAYVAAVERLAMVIAPGAGLLLGDAQRFVVLVLGPHWAEAGPILSWMGLAAIYMPVTYTLSWLYISQGRTSEMLRAGFVGAGLTLAFLGIGLPFGPVGVAASFAVSGCLVRGPTLFWLAGRDGPVSFRDIVFVLRLPACAAAAAAIAIAGLSTMPGIEGLPDTLGAVLMLGTALLAALLTYAAFPRGRDVMRDIHRLPSLLRAGRAGA